MRVGSLFSGIGGLDLGLERAGMEIVWQAEVDPYCSRVLEKHWPNVPNLGDVTKVDWNDVEPVDLVCGGYPCQPFSTASAGRRLGADDERHLWPYMLNAIRVLRPRLALLENVSGHLGLGFGDVLADLAASGYDAEWDCIPAAAVGAPHRRDRVFILAHSDKSREHDGPVDAEAPGAPESVANADSATRSTTRSPSEAIFGPGALERLGRCRSGFGAQWAVEPDVGRVAHGVSARVDRLRGLGNAVVPQVAEWIGHRILEAFNVESSPIPRHQETLL